MKVNTGINMTNLSGREQTGNLRARFQQLIYFSLFVVFLGVSPTAFATNTLEPTTAFEIDGDAALDGMGPLPNMDGDWDELYGPGLTVEGNPTNGVYYYNRNDDLCDDAADDQTGSSVKILSGPVWPSVTTSGSPPNNKTDLDYVDLAAEKVDVDNQTQDILYVGYKGCFGSPGSFSALLYLDDGDGKPVNFNGIEDDVDMTNDDRDGGDILFRFDFNPGTGSVVITQYDLQLPAGSMVQGDWLANVAPPANSIVDAAAGRVPDDGPDLGDDFGEVAINLTALGVLPEDECKSITVDATGASLTGGSEQSQVKDIVQVDPLTISNCGDLKINKASSPAGLSSTIAFDYVVDQSGGDAVTDIVHDDTLDLAEAPLVMPEFTDEIPAPDMDNLEISASIQAENMHSWMNVIAQTDYLLTEALPPPASGWQLQTIECEYVDIFADPFDPTNTTSVTLYDIDQMGVQADAVFHVSPDRIQLTGSSTPVDITQSSCTMTNATAGVKVVKTGTGDETVDFPFTITSKPDFSLRIADDPMTPDPVLENEASFGFSPGTMVTITETQPLPTTTPGWSLDSIVCTNDGSGTLVQNIDENAGTAQITTLPGETITCTFENNQNAQLILEKDWVEALQGDSATLTADLTSNGIGADDTFMSPVDAATPATETDIDATPLEFTPGDTINLAETLNMPDNYTSTLACDGGGTLAPDADGRSGILTTDETADAGASITCTFVNTRKDVKLTVIKDLMPASDDGLFIMNAAGVMAPMGGAGDGAMAMADLKAGDSNIVFGESAVAPTDLANYTSTYQCVDGNMDVIAAGNGTGGTITTMPDTDVVCTILNTRKVVDVTIAKAWAGDTSDTSSTTITTTGAAMNLDASVDSGTAYSEMVSVPIGGNLGFSETGLANYSEQYACTYGGTATLPSDMTDVADAAAYGDSFTIPADADVNAITCTFTNTRKVVDVTIAKAWAGDTSDTSSTTITTTGAAMNLDASVDSGTAYSEMVSVPIGGDLGFSETGLANYSEQYACTYGGTATLPSDMTDVADAAAYGDSFTIPADADVNAITCTFTNTRKVVDVTIAKAWAGDTSDTSSTTITTTGAAMNLDASVDSGTAYSEMVSVPIGGDLGFSETGLANYSEQYACTYGGTATLPSDMTDVADAAAYGDSFTIPADADVNAITCTFTNTRKVVDVTIAKAWAGDTSDTSSTTITTTGAAMNLDASVDSGTAYSEMVSVPIGGDLGFSETGLANYSEQYACTYGGTATLPSDMTDVADAAAYGDSFTIPADADVNAITCTFTNTRKVVDVTIAKAWAGDTSDTSSTTITTTGAAMNLDASVDSGTAYSEMVSVPIGGDLGFSETGLANYSEQYACTYGGTATLPSDMTDVADAAAYGDSFTIPADADVNAITCTFTNTRKVVDVTIAKAWAGDTSDTSSTTITTTGAAMNLDASVDSGTAYSEMVSVPIGGDLGFSETGLANYSEQYACTYGGTATLPSDMTDVADAAAYGDSFTIPADADVNAITCTFTNTRKVVDVTIAKAWAGDTSDTSSTTITTTGAAMNLDASVDSGTAYSEMVSVPIGGDLGFSETGLANYSEQYACTYGGTATLPSDMTDVADAAAYGDSFTIPADADVNAITCTFTNTRKVVDVTIAKAWAGDTSDTSSTTITTTGAAMNLDASVDSGTAYSEMVSVPIGGDLGFSETGLANYSEQYACTYGGTATLPSDMTDVADAAAYGDSFTIPADADVNAITCTFTNTIIPAELTLAKVVQNGTTGTASITNFTLTATGPETVTGISGTTEVTDVLVDIGDYTLTESSVSGYSLTTLMCENATQGGTDVGGVSTTNTTVTLAPNDDVTCTFTNAQLADLVVEKSVDPEAVAADGILTFTIDLRNDGALSETNIVLTDLLPGGLIYDSHVAATGTFTPSATGGEWSIDALAGGDSTSLTLTVTLEPVAGICAVEYRNVVTIDSQGGVDYDDTTDHEDDATAYLVSIAVAKQFVSATAVGSGEVGDFRYQVVYELLAVNNGGVDLNSVQIIDDLNQVINDPNTNDATIVPGSVSVANAGGVALPLNTNYDGTTDTNLLVGNGDLAVGSEAKFTITFEMLVDVYFGDFTNQATITAMAGDVAVEDLSEDGPAVTNGSRLFSANAVTNDAGCVQDSPTVFRLNIPATPATINWFKANDLGGIVAFDWTSGAEIANAGFIIEAQDEEGSWNPVSELIPSQGDATVEQHYQHEVVTSATVFRLVDVDISGKRTEHGPYELDTDYGQRSPRKATDWDAIEQDSDAARETREQRLREQLREKLQQSAPTTYWFRAPQSEPATPVLEENRMQPTNTQPDSWLSRVKTGAVGLLALGLNSLVPSAHALDVAALDIHTSGVYKVRHQDLLNAGIDLSGISKNQIGIRHVEHGSVPVKVTGGSNFGNNGTITFAAYDLTTTYVDKNTYVLTVNEGQVEIGTDDGAIPNGPAAYSYLAHKRHAPQNHYSHTSPDRHDAWYAESLKAISRPASTDITLEVDGYAPVVGSTSSTGSGAQSAVARPTLQLDLWGASNPKGDGVANPDHHVTVDLNGERIQDIRFDGLQVKQTEQVLDNLASGTQSITLSLPKSHGYAFDFVRLDEIAISYPRKFWAEQSKHLVFDSEWNKFLVRKLNSETNVEVYRMNAQGDVDQITQTQGKGCTNGQCRVMFKGADEKGQLHRYFVSSAPRTPGIRLVDPDMAPIAGQVDHILIAHSDFINNSQLQAYANQLQANGDTVEIVDVAGIYARYTGHIVDASAIQAYIQEAYELRGTRNISLIGDDNYDYHNNLGTNAQSFIPSLYVRIAQNVNAVPSDPKYADIDDDNIPDLGITRLPVRSNTELNRILAKHSAYQNRSYSNKTLFAADEQENSGYSFKADAEAIKASFNGWQASTAYMDDMTPTQASQTVVNQINQGVSLTHYFGHGNTDRWGRNDALLVGEQVGNLINQGKPTVVLQWACWNNFYVNPQEDALGHRFLTESENGAVTVMGATSLTTADAEQALAQKLYAHLHQGKSIAKAVLDAKRELAQDRPHQLDILLGWTTLGPADMVVSQ